MLPKSQSIKIGAHQGAILALTYNSDGQYALSAGHDKVIRLWNTAKGTKIKEYAGTHGYEIADISCAPDNSKFLSCGRDRAVFLTDVTSGRVLRRFSKHDQRVNCVAFNQDASVVFSGSYDRTLCCWDIRAQTRDPLFVFTDANDSVTRVAVTPSEVVTASVDGCARTYDLRAGRLTIDHQGDPITSMVISADNNCLLVSVLASTIRLIDRSNGEMLNEYRADGFRNEEFQLDSRLSRDDAAVVSGSEDGIIRYWDLVSGELLRKLSGHTGPVTRLAVHPNKDQLMSAGIDGTLRIWS